MKLILIAITFIVATLAIYEPENEKAQHPMMKPGDVPPEVMASLQKSSNPAKKQKGFKTNFGGSCDFTCSRGARPVPKKNHIPQFNGCNLPMDVPGVDLRGTKYDFRGCCNEHDRCYNTCGNSKDQCDTGFHECMKIWCDYSFGNSRNKKKQADLEQCDKKADLMNTMTKLMQCEQYLTDQQDACDCVGRDEF